MKGILAIFAGISLIASLCAMSSEQITMLKEAYGNDHYWSMMSLYNHYMRTLGPQLCIDISKQEEFNIGATFHLKKIPSTTEFEIFVNSLGFIRMKVPAIYECSVKHGNASLYAALLNYKPSEKPYLLRLDVDISSPRDIKRKWFISRRQMIASAIIENYSDPKKFNMHESWFNKNPRNQMDTCKQLLAGRKSSSYVRGETVTGNFKLMPFEGSLYDIPGVLFCQIWIDEETSDLPGMYIFVRHIKEAMKVEWYQVYNNNATGSAHFVVHKN